MSIANVELVCDGCEKSIWFPVSTVGTVQECPHCGGYVDVELPDDVEPKNANDDETESKRQWKESARQLEVAKQHQEETGGQLEKTALLQAQIEGAIQHFTRFTSRCEQLAERFEKVLKKWEGRDSS